MSAESRRRGPRRASLRVSEEELAEVRAVADRLHMPLNTALRLLVARGLDKELMDPTPVRHGGSRRDERAGDRQVMLAALLAAEHTLLMLAQQISGGAQKAAALEEAAAAAAQRRLARVARADGVEGFRPAEEAVG